MVHADARGLKSKINSIKEIIKEDDLTSMCLVEIYMENKNIYRDQNTMYRMIDEQMS